MSEDNSNTTAVSDDKAIIAADSVDVIPKLLNCTAKMLKGTIGSYENEDLIRLLVTSLFCMEHSNRISEIVRSWDSGALEKGNNKEKDIQLLFNKIWVEEPKFTFNRDGLYFFQCDAILISMNLLNQFEVAIILELANRSNIPMNETESRSAQPKKHKVTFSNIKNIDKNDAFRYCNFNYNDKLSEYLNRSRITFFYIKETINKKEQRKAHILSAVEVAINTMKSDIHRTHTPQEKERLETLKRIQELLKSNVINMTNLATLLNIRKIN